jgi:hypothetical protein
MLEELELDEVVDEVVAVEATDETEVMANLSRSSLRETEEMLEARTDAVCDWL